MRKRYPHESTQAVAKALRRTVQSVYRRAGKLGLRKTEEYLASPAACRLRRGGHIGAKYQFSKGHTPANKGMRCPGWAPGRMRETQFKKGDRKGRANLVYQPIGTERISKDGYRERKVNDEMPFQRRWRAVHLIAWEEANGPLPPGHAIAFKNGDRTDIRLENLECITRRELMLRNSVHHLPKPLVSAIQLLGALNRQINKKERQNDEKHD
jgi:HNH endonuclease